MSDNDRTTTAQERLERGRSLREKVPRSSRATWMPSPSRSDPISLLQEQDKGRLKHFLPIKYGRMLKSPFTFMRGAAILMTTDLATTSVTGQQVQLCGDADLLNFGIFAIPEHKLVFDSNDFDETYPGPWDLKRLATSAVVVGRKKGFSDEVNRKLSVTVSNYYRSTLASFAWASFLYVWYYEVEVDKFIKAFKKILQELQKKCQKSCQEGEQKYSGEHHGRAHRVGPRTAMNPKRSSSFGTF